MIDEGEGAPGPMDQDGDPRRRVLGWTVPPDRVHEDVSGDERAPPGGEDAKKLARLFTMEGRPGHLTPGPVDLESTEQSDLDDHS